MAITIIGKNFSIVKLECMYGQQGFCSLGISMICKKVFKKEGIPTFYHPNI